MRRDLSIAVVAGAIVAVVAGVVFLRRTLQVPALPPAPPAWPETSTPAAAEIYLAYQEQTIPDEDLARVVDLIVNSVPQDAWATAALAEREGVDGIIDRVYDYYVGRREDAGQRDDYRKPLTTAAIRRAIVAANPGVDGAGPGFSVRLPPVPVRGFGRYDFPTAIRAFEPERQAYAMRQDPLNVRIATTRLVDDVSAMGRQRGATTTMVLLPVNERLLSFVEQSGRTALPGTVAYLSARPNEVEPDKRIVMARVEFLQPATPALPACEDAGKWFDESPYKSEALARVRAVPRAQLIARAKASPLTVLDTDFTGLGHGAKVLKVVDYTLATLEVPDEVRAAGLVRFDLVGSSADAKAEMHRLLNLYLESDDAPRDVPQAAETRRWIDEESQFAALPGYNVPDLLLQAIFRHFLRAPGWINMSFRVDSPALRLVQRAFVQDRRSLAVVAAGNDPGELAGGWLPQESASVFPTVVNVSFGTRGGLVWGPRSGTIDRTVVSVLGPGCGYERVGFSDRGSSFASPYVAAATWVKSLVDQLPPLTMSRTLLAAAQPVPEEAAGIEAGGFFDAARLLAAPRAHLLSKAPQPTIEPVDAPFVNVTCALNDEEDRRLRLGPRPGVLRSLVVYQSHGNEFLWLREVPLDPAAPLKTILRCRVTEFTFSVGGIVKYDKAVDFARAVGELAM